jgi:hypothetical protein
MVAVHARAHLLDEIFAPSNVEHVAQHWRGMNDVADLRQQRRASVDTQNRPWRRHPKSGHRGA